MKNTRFTSILGSSFIACALAIGSLASTQSASAQTPIAKVTIPFDFQTQSQTLPAGTYLVERKSPNLILLEAPGQKGSFILMHAATKTNAPDHGSLVFDHSGNNYYLRQIWTAGDPNGLECPKSRAEKAAAQLASNPEPVTRVELAFNSAPQK